MTNAQFAPEYDYDDPALDQASEHVTKFRNLGALEVWHDGRRCEIRGTMQRTLLAALLAAGSRPVSGQALVHELWATIRRPPRGEDILEQRAGSQGVHPADAL
jgi:hypothetical protein